MRSTGRTSSTIVRVRVLVAAGLSVLALSVWVAGRMQYRAADQAVEDGRAAQRMMIAMLDQQTGVRGFALTRNDAFLDPYHDGADAFDDAVASLRRLDTTAGDRAVADQVAAAREWRELAERRIAQLRTDPDAPVIDGGEVARKRDFDRFRQLNAEFQSAITREIDDQLLRAGTLAFGPVFGLSVLLVLVGYLAIERQARRAWRRREGEEQARHAQAEFAETMQVMRNEVEAYDLVKRHLERAVPSACVAVLNRNNSDNRLEAATALADDPELAERLRAAAPDSCVAIRLGRTFTRDQERVPLLTCEMCAAAPQVVCIPSLVSGDVIGSVLLRRERVFGGDDVDRAAATVAQSAPVLANLRSLAIAETRAATDALTGLPNNRACRDTLKRMVAHAGRALSPLSAILIDLDHFKQVNDRFGHGAGDDVLAATGAVLNGTVRSSDFVGRSGGEEFLALLPDTDKRGAMQVAEKVRSAISRIHVSHVDRAITASVGVATFPDDAADGDTLVRHADRALYAAKAAGRNRVEAAVWSDEEGTAIMPGAAEDEVAVGDLATPQ